MFFVIYVIYIYYKKVITHIFHKIIKYHHNSITFFVIYIYIYITKMYFEIIVYLFYVGKQLIILYSMIMFFIIFVI